MIVLHMNFGRIICTGYIRLYLNRFHLDWNEPLFTEQHSVWLTVVKNRFPHFCTLVLKYLEFHDDVIKWKHFPRYWQFVWGIHRSPENSPHKGQWGGALMFSLICVWRNGWANNHEAGDLRSHRAHYEVIVMHFHQPISWVQLVFLHFILKYHGLIFHQPEKLSTVHDILPLTNFYMPLSIQVHVNLPFETWQFH